MLGTPAILDDVGENRDNWLAAVIREAVENNWCTRRVCTTCGANDFRRAIWAAAAEQVGRSLVLACGEWPYAKLMELPAIERDALVGSLVAGLRGLPRWFRHDEAVLTVRYEIERLGPSNDPSLSLTQSTDEGLQRRDVVTANWISSWHESKIAEDQRRKEAQARREKNRLEHHERKVMRDTKRAVFLDKLRQLPTLPLIARLARETGQSIDAVPPGLIDLEALANGPLDRSAAELLVERISRRRGQWGQIGLVLRQRLASAPREGDRRQIGARLEYFDGTDWIDAWTAVDELGVDLEEVGELIVSRNVGRGAYGSPAEYSIAWRLWRVGDRWIVDQSDEGMGYHVSASEKAGRADLRRRLKALKDGDDPYS